MLQVPVTFGRLVRYVPASRLCAQLLLCPPFASFRIIFCVQIFQTCYARVKFRVNLLCLPAIVPFRLARPSATLNYHRLRQVLTPVAVQALEFQLQVRLLV